MPRQKVRVLIVDDSASVRQIFTTILNEDPDIEVMAAASDPFVAARRLQDELPDVIILDIEMPRMDGITFLRKIRTLVSTRIAPSVPALILRPFQTGVYANIVL